MPSLSRRVRHHPSRRFGLRFAVSVAALVSPLCAQQQANSLAAVSQELSQHQFEAALQNTLELLQSHPEDPRLWTLKGLAQNGQKNWKGALESFQHATQLQPTFAPALEGAAQTAYLNGDPDAMRYVGRLLEVEPNNGVANAMAGVLAYQAHDCEIASQYFDRSRSQIVANPRAVDQAADCLLQKHRSLDAAVLLSDALQRHPQRSDLAYNLGLAEVQSHKPDEAIKVLQPWRDSKDADLLNLLAYAFTEAKLPDDAFRLLERAIEADPQQQRNYLDLAILCLEHNQEKRSIAAATAGIARVQKPMLLYLIRGVAYAQLADYTKAEADFTQASTLEPEQPNSTVAMSLLLSDRNELPRERQLLEAQLVKTPRDPVTNYLYADLLVRTGVKAGQPAFNQALHSAEVSIEGRPDAVEAQVLMARLLEEKGELLPALEHVKMAIKLDPKNQAALHHEILLLNKLQRKEEAVVAVRQLRDLINARMQEEQNTVRVEPSGTEPGQPQPH